MLGTKIVLNEEKILREEKYDIVELYDLIDNFAENLGFTKDGQFTYIARDDKYALANMGKFCHSGLMKCDWFVDNVLEWIWIDDEDGNTDLMKRIVSNPNVSQKGLSANA